MLILQSHACRLLIMHHALHEIRTVHEQDSERPLQHWFEVQTEGRCVALLFGRLALTSAEAVLTEFLTASDLILLGTAPDNLYVMVGFSATWIFISNFSIHQLSSSKLGGASERLQAMTIERLNLIADAPEHPAARCGHVLGALLNAWQLRKPVDGNAKMFQCPGSSVVPSQPTPVYHGDGNSIPNLGSNLGNDATNSDPFTDDTLWRLFMEDLSSDMVMFENSTV